MAPHSDNTRKFVEEGGDALLLQALESIVIIPGARNSKSAYALKDGKRGSYNACLADFMNFANSRQHLSTHTFFGDEVKQRLDSLSSTLKGEGRLQKGATEEQRKDARIAALRDGTAGSAAAAERMRNPENRVRYPLPPGHQVHHYAPQQQSLPSISHMAPDPTYASSSTGYYAQQQQPYDPNAPQTLQPPYTGPPGPSDPYNQYYRSLGHAHGRFSFTAAARPLRHAVIYDGGEGRRF